MQTRSTLFKNFERLSTHDLLSYGQLSYDTILTSIQSNNTFPLSVNVKYSSEHYEISVKLTLNINKSFKTIE